MNSTLLKKMYGYVISGRIALMFLFVVAIAGCKVALPPDLPPVAQLPESYLNRTDSVTDARIEWREFFRDSTLENLIEVGLNNNFDLLKATQRVEIARANFIVRKNAFFPSINLVASSNIGNVNQNMVGNADQSQRINNIRDEYFVGLQSAWEADVWGKLKNQKEASFARYLSTVNGRHLVTTLVVSEIAARYYELLAVDKELEVVRTNIELQETVLEIIGIQKMGGRATELAVQQSTAQLLRTKALEKEKQQRIVELETEINFLIGRYPQHIGRDRTITDLKLPAPIHEGVPSSLLLNRPDIRLKEYELVAARADLQAARAAFLPSISISPYAGFNALAPSVLFQTPESLAAGLLGGIAMPIFNKKNIKSDFNRAAARRAESYYEYQESIIRAYGEVVNNMQRINNLESMYTLKEQEVEVLLNSVSTARILFTSGYANYLEVVTAQKNVLEAELEMANIKKEIFHSVIGLYRALGGGWTQ